MIYKDLCFEWRQLIESQLENSKLTDRTRWKLELADAIFAVGYHGGIDIQEIYYRKGIDVLMSTDPFFDRDEIKVAFTQWIKSDYQVTMEFKDFLIKMFTGV